MYTIDSDETHIIYHELKCLLISFRFKSGWTDKYMDGSMQEGLNEWIANRMDLGTDSWMNK
jgi:hypothetical protein